MPTLFKRNNELAATWDPEAQTLLVEAAFDGGDDPTWTRITCVNDPAALVGASIYRPPASRLYPLQVVGGSAYPHGLAAEAAGVGKMLGFEFRLTGQIGEPWVLVWSWASAVEAGWVAEAP